MKSKITLLILVVLCCITQASATGESCELAATANIGENVVPATNNGYWYRYTVPNNIAGKKIVITSQSGEYVEMYYGSCGSLSFEDEGYENLVLTDLAPNVEILFYWFTYNGGDFTWNLTVQDLEPGDNCLLAVVAQEGDIVLPQTTNQEYWYSFTLPNDVTNKKLVISTVSNSNVYIYSNTCDNLYYVTSGWEDIIVTDINANEELFIRWSTINGGDFTWNLSLQNLEPGDDCLLAVVAQEGDIVLPQTINNYYWYSYTLPGDVTNKKLVITSNISDYVEAYSNTCDNLFFEIGGYGGLTLTNINPNEEIFFKWPTYNGGDFAWNLSLQNLGAGDNCLLAVTAQDGDNVLPPTTNNYYWYSYILPSDVTNKKLVISSNSYENVDIYTNSCDNLFYNSSNWQNIILYDISPNEEIYIRWGTSYGGDFTWNILLEDIAPGDNCSLAVNAFQGLNNTPNAAYWFKYTIPENGNYVISSLGLANNDTYLLVYDACGGNQLAVNDDFGGTLQSQITLNAMTAGTELLILWDDIYSSNGFDWSIKESQSISFDPIPDHEMSPNAFLLTATTTSSLPITYTSTNTNVAIVNGNMVTLIGVGATTIIASQSGDDGYIAAENVEQSFNVIQGSQYITFNPLVEKSYNDPTFQLTAMASSNLPLNFTSSNENVATVSGNTVSIIGAGTATITATQPGNVNYYAAVDVQQVLTVVKDVQQINFEAIPDKTVFDATFELTATGGASGNSVIFSSSDENVATISGNTVSIVGAGATIITASQEGNSNYTAAPDVEQTLTVVQGTQSITFNELSAKTFGDAAFNVTASASSNLEVTYTSTNENVATISGNTVTIIGAGTTDITASQAGNTNYAAATPVTRTLTVNKATQTIEFTPVQDQLLEDGSVTLSATASSGLQIAFEVVDGPATVTGSTVSFTDLGSVTIRATQAGNTNYLEAHADQSFEITSITGFEDLGFGVKIYPNPVKDVLQLDIEGNNVQKISLIGMNGSVLMSIGKSERSIDLSHLQSGVYLLRVVTPDQTIVYQILKK